MDNREFDLLVFGASGFAGRLLAAHLDRHAPIGMRIALAGRSPERIEGVRASLRGAGRSWPILVADATDALAMATLARRTNVVVTTVGPYARYGTALVAACARAGTHYADLTGEVLFMRRTIDADAAAARASGARIVHACGFDSVPSDLGVWSLHEYARTSGAGGLRRVTGLFTGGSGGFSGGTIDSLRAQLEDLATDGPARRIVTDPHALDPAGSTAGRPGPPDRWDPRWDADLGYWLAPFVMAPVNTRVVRRSHSLLHCAGSGYGAGFRYREAVGVRGRVAGAVPASAVAAATVGFGLAMNWGPARRLLDRALPAPGAGPSPRAMDRGYFRMRLVAETDSGRLLQADVGADLDPGYGATAVMLGESALALAAGEGDTRPGVLTPAVAFGGALPDRLRSRGFTCEVSDRSAAGRPRR